MAFHHVYLLRMITVNIKQPIKRYSWQREAILDVLRSTREHPTADWIYEQIKAVIPSISLGTVYRNLQQLAQAGLIKAYQFQGNKVRYDANIEHHLHFICERCQRVEDYSSENLQEPLELLSQSVPATVSHSELFLYGTCKKCSSTLEEK